MTLAHPPFSAVNGLLLILAYGLCAFALTWLSIKGRAASKLEFLLADRNLGARPAVFWFVAPNVACLLLFAPFAARIRRLAPDGFTLSAYMRERYSPRVQIIYQLQLVGLAICSCGVQLLAGGAVIVFLTSLPFFPVTLLLMLIALSYSLFGGLRASVQTDHAKMILILTTALIAMPWVLLRGGAA
ncbi:MAG: hypothetical protein D3903_05080 [Candidatus Electrothrix sp. GM3_4]|nr:hypothetical protein [Candidatus Electrothrix sp. GM3_4]